jgi:hypothetical protein
MGFGPEERELFESGATALYDEIVAAGGIPVDDARIADDSERRPAFDLLTKLDLVRLDVEQDLWLPEDPAAAHAQLVTPMSREGTRLLEEGSAWARSLESLTQSFRGSSLGDSTEAIRYLRTTAIRPFLATVVGDAQEEILTAQPQAGRDPEAPKKAQARDTAFLERGGTMRTLYQHSARQNKYAREYVEAVTSLGGEVRTLDEFFNRLFVIDRKMAVIPGEDREVAVVIREPAIVAYLVDVFERRWDRGRPFTAPGRETARQIAAEQRAMTIRMLIAGHSDPVSAKRLGVSQRTYADYVADLKREFDVATRLQLGYELGKRGVSGHEIYD